MWRWEISIVVGGVGGDGVAVAAVAMEMANGLALVHGTPLLPFSSSSSSSFFFFLLFLFFFFLLYCFFLFFFSLLFFLVLFCFFFLFSRPFGLGGISILGCLNGDWGWRWIEAGFCGRLVGGWRAR